MSRYDDFGEYSDFDDFDDFTNDYSGEDQVEPEVSNDDGQSAGDVSTTTVAPPEAPLKKPRRKRKRRISPEKEMTFIEHLAELRSRIIRCFIYAVIGGAIGWYQYERIWQLIIAPIRPAMEKYAMPLVFGSIFEPLLFRLQISLVAGLAIAAPLIFYEIIAFVWPGLLPHEKRFAIGLIPASLVFFIGGIILAYELIPIAALFMLRFLPKDAQVLNFVRLYAWSVAKIALAMGLVFQMPLVFMMLAKMGLITSRTLITKWRYAVVAILTVAAIVTPTIDPINMLLLAAPILLLYILSIILVLWVER
ncbi:MAG TPA: twin-arginine translocase subunit TatC [Armatimonadetes bacterium]|nr:twin-arginine translocase subunit TatC [Armatimonadota bacterium]